MSPETVQETFQKGQIAVSEVLGTRILRNCGLARSERWKTNLAARIVQRLEEQCLTLTVLHFGRQISWNSFSRCRVKFLTKNPPTRNDVIRKTSLQM